MRNANKVSMILDLAHKSGIVIANISKELGLARSTLLSWKGGFTNPTEDNEDRLYLTIKARANYLSQVDLTRTDLSYIKDKLGLTYTSIASELGYSKQWISQAVEEGLEHHPELREEIQSHIRTIGKNLLKGLKH